MSARLRRYKLASNNFAVRETTHPIGDPLFANRPYIEGAVLDCCPFKLTRFGGCAIAVQNNIAESQHSIYWKVKQQQTRTEEAHACSQDPLREPTRCSRIQCTACRSTGRVRSAPSHDLCGRNENKLGNLPQREW